MQNSCSAYADIPSGFLQESIWGPLLFNANVFDMFCEKYEYGFANYAADNASHTCDSDLFTFLSKLKKS